MQKASPFSILLCLIESLEIMTKIGQMITIKKQPDDEKNQLPFSIAHAFLVLTAFS